MQPKVKIRVTELVTEIYEQYRPAKGKVYDAVKGRTKLKQKEFVVLDILDKKIILRKGEFEYLGV